MKTPILTLSLIFLFSMMNFSDGYSQQRERKLYKFKQDRVIDKLNLSDEQSNKISDLRTKHQKIMVDLKANLQKIKIDMRELRKSSDLNRSKLTAVTEKINDIRNKMAIERANHQMDIYELLDADQKKIWQEHEPLRLRGEGKSFRGEGKFKGGGFGYRSGLCW
jgi:Spy/CpxP family protein refolding chaperone